MTYAFICAACIHRVVLHTSATGDAPFRCKLCDCEIAADSAMYSLSKREYEAWRLDHPEDDLGRANPLACYQCGLLYGGPGWCDVVVNDDVWVAISPTGDGGGILCFNCIAARLDDLGMTGVRMLVKSGPFEHDSRDKQVSEP